MIFSKNYKITQMKTLVSIFCASLAFLAANAQESIGGRPASFKVQVGLPQDETTHRVYFTKPNIQQLAIEDAENDSKGAYRVGINLATQLSPQTSGTWTTQADGSRIWKLEIYAKDAKALSLYFENEVKLPKGATLFAYNKNKRQVLGAYTAETEKFAAMEMVEGDLLTLEYNAPATVTEQPEIDISHVVYFYRGVEDHVSQFSTSALEKAESCEVDVACPEGSSWSNQINAVVHYTFSQGGSTYVCSGSLMNNTAQDCKPYILTAWHCGEPTTSTNINTWVWYWKYQKTTCQTGAANGTDPSPGSFTKTGGSVRASAGNGTLNNPPGNSQVAGSDFYLVELGSSIPSTYSPYYAGWNRSNTAATSGVGIHHPAGSAKKISTYSASLVSSSYNSGAANAHWRVTWVATQSGHGVTEGGSSGSPIFNQNGLVVGQLSGGSSYCNATSSPDLYGKLYTDWDLNGTSSGSQLKPWLDPGNTGVTSLNGSASPCATVTAPVANFAASQTTVTTGSTITFTDQSTNTPTSWSWSITPGSGWSYAGGTSATSQNPQVTFTTAGSYTVSLTASNSAGSDNETKVSYIVVTTASAPCTAYGTTCDEFIQNVNLNTINNTSSCTNYMSYSNSTLLTKGSSYTITITPQIPGNDPGTAYTNDEIAAWIDFNGDLDFSDQGEQIAYLLVGSGSNSTSFNFTVPLNAVTGTVKLRARISFSTDGAITPCGTSTYGEVEDYNIILSSVAAELNDNILSTVTVYPNPANSEVSIDLSSIIDEQVSLELMDMTGKVIATQTNVAGAVTQFDLTQVAKGMYQIRMFTSGTNRVERIIKL